jgi:hypothetical protein
VELTVSGGITATFPLPALASDESWLIAEKSFVNWLGEIVGVAALEAGVLALVDELEDDELPHPAITAPRATASAAA